MSSEFESDKSVILAALEEARRLHAEGQHNKAEPLFLEAIQHLSPGDEAVGHAITCLTEIYTIAGRHYDAYLINQTFIDGAAPIDSGALREQIGTSLERMAEMCQLLGDSNIAQVLRDKAQGVKAGRLQSASLIGRLPVMDDPRGPSTRAPAANQTTSDTALSDSGMRQRPQRPSLAGSSPQARPPAQPVGEAEIAEEIAAEQWPAKNKPPQPAHTPVQTESPAAAEAPPATARPSGPPPPSPKQTGTKLQMLVAHGPSPKRTSSQPALQPPEAHVEQQEVFEPRPAAPPEASQAPAPAPDSLVIMPDLRPTAEMPSLAELDAIQAPKTAAGDPKSAADSNPQSWLASKRAKDGSDKSSELITRSREDWSKPREKKEGEEKKEPTTRTSETSRSFLKTAADSTDGAQNEGLDTGNTRNLRDKMVSFDKKSSPGGPAGVMQSLKTPKGIIIAVAAIVVLLISSVAVVALMSGKDLPPPEIEPTPNNSTSMNSPSPVPALSIGSTSWSQFGALS